MVTEHLLIPVDVVPCSVLKTRLKIGADEFESHTLMQPITRRIGRRYAAENRQDPLSLEKRHQAAVKPSAQTAAHCALGEINRKLSVPLIRRSFHMTVGIGIAHAAPILFGDNVGIKAGNGANAFGEFFCCRQRVFKRNR